MSIQAVSTFSQAWGVVSEGFKHPVDTFAKIKKVAAPIFKKYPAAYVIAPVAGFFAIKAIFSIITDLLILGTIAVASYLFVKYQNGKTGTENQSTELQEIEKR